MAKFIVGYDHHEETNTEISIESEGGEKLRFETIVAAEAWLEMPEQTLLDKLEANNGSIEVIVGVLRFK